MPADEQSRIEALGDHDYLIHTHVDDDVTIRIKADPETVTRIAGPNTDEVAIIEATIAYLTAWQRADELPEQLDLNDVAAAYDNFVDELRRQFLPCQDN